ncbi:MAG TPA: tRNA (adenosine(37)-N6)-dimethylallyltransferase MiaA [Bacteroidales bacterium]|jgi:tRNA dimethylallyltransferase|nr:tRNA (adenosine(37)-N6)-dimethylallyltransferase MiaA [Bacteroidales bacterium]MDD4235130.1 tRNA (adenosine(37)-N6)-dimethylallyltransferase MiaA [Bacteroidales bacterium]HXK82338.1 tRNA (adenosine(37)-N6)-dimethylallyltransferase MiaA [Bacteroidales bacterium]
MRYDLICILGHTAGGKTSIAANLANILGGEIISADSRQVYKYMDIGTGKDLDEYIVNGNAIPYHLIDIVEPGTKYNIFEYTRDFKSVFDRIDKDKQQVIMCGGSGLYIESVLENFQLLKVPVNNELRNSLQNKTLAELEQILLKKKKLHNKTDTDTKKRAIRAIEIADYYENSSESFSKSTKLNSIVFGISYNRELRRKRITERLYERLNEGLIEEAIKLHDMGLSYEDMEYYGLEYKYLSLFLQNKLTKIEMIEQLNIAIHQFAKRQMTWFRKMERNGREIHWIDGGLSLQEKLSYIQKILQHA